MPDVALLFILRTPSFTGNTDQDAVLQPLL